MVLVLNGLCAGCACASCAVGELWVCKFPKMQIFKSASCAVCELCRVRVFRVRVFRVRVVHVRVARVQVNLHPSGTGEPY